MASALKKNIGKLGQWTGEKLGRDANNKTETSDEFKDLIIETENRYSGMESINTALQLYVAQLLKKKDASDSSRQKLYLLENLGSTMFNLGTSLPRDSVYGKALERLGQVEERLNDSQVRFVTTAKETLGSGLQRAMDDFNEYTNMKKKLETRRADYDSKLVKLQKTRKENVHLEDELRSAQTRYEDTHDDVARRMMDLQDSEQVYLQDLYEFYESQVAYHKHCFEMLESIRGTFSECLSTSRLPASERNPIASTLTTRKSAVSLRSNDMSIRRVVPPFAGHTHSNSLPRSMSAFPRTPSALHQSTSQQPQYYDTDDSDDAQAQYNYAHGIDATHEPGMLEGSPVMLRGAATLHHPTATRPPLAQSRSDFSQYSSSGTIRRQAPPPPAVAPRRHAPPPPMPTRTPRRILRKAIYAFSADEEGELPMGVGDIVEVTERIDDGWWMGKLVHSLSPASASSIGATGLFPSNYTEDCDEAEVPPKKHAPPLPNNGKPKRLADPFNGTASASNGNAQVGASTIAQCSCGCDDYLPNQFKKGSCVNCFHIH